MKLLNIKKSKFSNEALKKLAKTNVFKTAAVALVLFAAINISLASNKDANNQTSLQPEEQTTSSQQLSGGNAKPAQEIGDVPTISNAPNNSQTATNTEPPDLKPQEPAPDYSGLQLDIETIEKATVYFNGQPKTVYNFFGQVQYASGPSSNTVNNGECTLRLTKQGRGAYGDFTETAESQGNSYGPTCSFQVLVGRPKLTTGSWLATMTYTTLDGLGKVTDSKGFTVD